MPPELRGHPVFDLLTESVRFAGFPDSKPWQTRVVICLITRGALQELAQEMGPEPEESLAAFESNAKTIHEIASSEFDTGNWRPTITDEMI
jgi:hypothetical protein